MDIDPKALYPFAEAARLIPSCRAGKRLHWRTLHKWRKAGRLKAVSRGFGRYRHWFLPGHEILRLAQGDQVHQWDGTTPAERRRGAEAARRRWEEMDREESCRRSAGGAGSSGAGGPPGAGSGSRSGG